MNDSLVTTDVAVYQSHLSINNHFVNVLEFVNNKICNELLNN